MPKQHHWKSRWRVCWKEWLLWKHNLLKIHMNNPNLASQMRKRRAEAIARAKRKREQREYIGNISVRNIIRNLARVSEEERQKAYEELKIDFPEARNKELRKDQFDKIVREEQQRIREANTIDLTGDTPPKKQRKMTEFLEMRGRGLYSQIPMVDRL